MYKKLTPYNPAGFHANVVNNLRAMYKEKYGKSCALSDKDIWAIYDNNNGCGETGEQDDILNLNDMDGGFVPKED